MSDDYKRYKANQKRINERGEHPLARRLGSFLSKIDYKDYDDSLGLSFGGDGDNGEMIVEQVSRFLYTLELSDI